MDWPARVAINTTAWVSTPARDPVLDFRCDHCGRVFNALTDTALHGLRRRPSELVLIIRGFAQGVPTAQLARELDCDRSGLLNLRHRLQHLTFVNRDCLPLDDPVLEGDQTYQNAGEKGCRISTRGIHRGGAATRRRGTAPGRMSARRSAESSGGRAVRSG